MTLNLNKPVFDFSLLYPKRTFALGISGLIFCSKTYNYTLTEYWDQVFQIIDTPYKSFDLFYTEIWVYQLQQKLFVGISNFLGTLVFPTLFA